MKDVRLKDGSDVAARRYNEVMAQLRRAPAGDREVMRRLAWGENLSWDVLGKYGFLDKRLQMKAGVRAILQCAIVRGGGLQDPRRE